MNDQAHQKKHATLDHTLSQTTVTLYTIVTLLLKAERAGTLNLNYNERAQLEDFRRFFLSDDEEEHQNENHTER